MRFGGVPSGPSALKPSQCCHGHVLGRHQAPREAHAWGSALATRMGGGAPAPQSPFCGNWRRLCSCELRWSLPSCLCLQGAPGGGSSGLGLQDPREGIWLAPCISGHSASGETKGQRGEALALAGSQGYFRTQMRDPLALGVGPRRSISPSLGPALLLGPEGVGLCLLGIYKIYPSNFGCWDLSEMQIGSGGFLSPVPRPSPHILH